MTMRVLLVLLFVLVVAGRYPVPDAGRYPEHAQYIEELLRFQKAIDQTKALVQRLPAYWAIAQRKAEASAAQMRTMVLDDYNYAGSCAAYTDSDGTWGDIMDLVPTACFDLMFTDPSHDDVVDCPVTDGTPTGLGFGACCDSASQCTSGICDMEKRSCTQDCGDACPLPVLDFGGCSDECEVCDSSNSCNVDDGIRNEFCMICYDYVGNVDAGVLATAGCTQYEHVENDEDNYSYEDGDDDVAPDVDDVDFDTVADPEKVCDFDAGVYPALQTAMTEFCEARGALLECQVPLTQIYNTLFAADCLDWTCALFDLGSAIVPYTSICMASGGYYCKVLRSCADEVELVQLATHELTCPDELMMNGCCLAMSGFNHTRVVDMCEIDTTGDTCDLAMGGASSVAPTAAVAVSALAVVLSFLNFF